MASGGDTDDLTRDRIPQKLWTKRVGLLSSTFVCEWKEFQRPGPVDLLLWKSLRCEPIPADEVLCRTLPIQKVKKDDFAAPPADKIRVTWIGHATMIVQFDEITVLTDPVFGSHAAPFQFSIMPYKRYRPAACQVVDIPHLDAVIISHNHYDHLETSAVQAINARFPDVRWFVALGTKEWLVKKGCNIENVTELKWWEEKTFKGIRFVCTPSQHWCQRYAFDLNKCLWCSWVLKGPNHTFYFAGDTGYYKELFHTIGRKFSPIHLAAIPIGAYNPRFITEHQHVNPEEAVQIHEDIKSQMSVGIHWGTFQLTNEHYLEPPHLVKKEMTNRALDCSKFVCMNIGETWDVGDPREEPQFMNETVKKEIEESRKRFEKNDV